MRRSASRLEVKAVNGEPFELGGVMALDVYPTVKSAIRSEVRVALYAIQQVAEIVRLVVCELRLANGKLVGDVKTLTLLPQGPWTDVACSDSRFDV